MCCSHWLLLCTVVADAVLADAVCIVHIGCCCVDAVSVYADDSCFVHFGCCCVDSVAVYVDAAFLVGAMVV